ncbi:MAG: thioredoxin domain-containing protein [Chloroflexota bacterium]
MALCLLLLVSGCANGEESDRSESLDPTRTMTVDGSLDAPVVIVEFADYACIACRTWHRSETKERLKEAYGDQISFVFKNFPIRSAQSAKAAEAGLCAGEQGMFWAYHNYIFEEIPRLELSVDQLKGYAVEVGLEPSAFNVCLDEGRFTAQVREEAKLARESGLRGTPGFLINDQLVPASSFDILSGAIQQELNELEVKAN